MDYQTFTSAREAYDASILKGIADPAERNKHSLAFFAKPFLEQVTALDAIPNFPLAVSGAYIALARTTLRIDSTPEARKATRVALTLPDPVPFPWAIPSPTQLLINPAFSEANSACKAASRGVFFKQASNPAAVVAEALHHLKLGGLEDVFNDNVNLSVTDRGHLANSTAQALHSAVMTYLEMNRPTWFENGVLRAELAAGDVTVSIVAQEAQIEAAKKAKRAEEARDRSFQRRQLFAQKMDAAYKIAELLFIREAGPVVDALNALSFEDLKAVWSGEQWPSPAIKATAASIVTRIDFTDLGDAELAATDLTMRYVTTQLAMKNPRWYRKLQSGAFTLRNEPLSVRKGSDGLPVLRREERSARIGILRILRNNGQAALVSQLAALAGIQPEALNAILPAIAVPAKAAAVAASDTATVPPAPPAAPPAPPVAPVAPAAPPAPPLGAPPAPPAVPPAPYLGMLG